ncbi:FUSC family protein [Streptomyces sp. NPDC005349]|uniref:FUSC family protein n=1 Tax=Streptomyces sp. NPDC005349 TaxID=3157037 RepID=UPI00339F1091
MQFLQQRDAGFTALRRSARAAVVAPGLFAITTAITDDATTPLFAAFGSIAMLLFVEFSGPMRERLIAQTALIAAGATLISLGTLTSQETWLATLATALVSFLLLFFGAVSSTLATATTALLISFILAATLPGPVQAIPDRLAGWAMAGAASLAAIRFLWPTPTREPLRNATAQACSAMAARLRIEVDCMLGGFEPANKAALETIVPSAQTTVKTLQTSFYATPYRPTGLTTSTRILIRLVDEVLWLETILDRVPLPEKTGPADAEVCELKEAAADLLETSAELLAATDHRALDELDAAAKRLAQSRSAMEYATVSARLTDTDSTATDPACGDAERKAVASQFVSSLEPSFRAQEMSFAVSAIAANIGLVVQARQRTLWQRLTGQHPERVRSTLASAQERAKSHAERHSVWLHNSVRGAISLGLAVLVADLAGVQHSFWVAFGTMAVLRSSALLTGQSSLRAIAGTTAGLVIGGTLVYLVGTNTAVLWAVLPAAVLFTGLAPATISFAAGQAGFTISILILFNILEPTGWTVGLVRIEDVTIGCAVSVLIGLLFWPRGAGSALGLATAEAFAESIRYLRSAIGYGVTRCDRLIPTTPVPEDERSRAAAAARRLDDAFRGFLAERGTKHVPLSDATALITAVAVLRLTADAVLDLWSRDRGTPAGDRTAARTEIDQAGTALATWYEKTANALSGFGEVPNHADQDPAAGARLIHTVERDLNDGEGRWSSTAIRVVWTADHIEAARRLESDVLKPAQAVARLQRDHNARMSPFRRTQPPHTPRC